MRHRIQYGFFQVMTELYHLFIMARRTEPAPSATEGKKIFMLAIWAFNTGEAVIQVSAFQVFPDYVIYNRTVKAIPALELLIVTFQKLDEMLIQELP